jgi:predicted MFS family arabinose efflux permease
MTGIYLGQALGGFGATVAGLFSWRSTFHTFGFIGIAYAVVLVFLLKEKRGSRLTDKRVVHHPPAPFFNGLGRLLARLSFWIILFSFAVASLPGWAVKNWLPTLFSQNLQLDMSKAGPISTISIAVFSLLGVLFGGAMSDQWAAKNVRGRIYTSCIGLSLTIPALLLIGFGHSAVSTVGAMFCFGFGYGMADANYMPILCQFVSPDSRATAYGLMNMTGVFAGAVITGQLGKLTDAGSLGMGFAALAAFVLLGVTIQYFFLKPKTSNA